ncbi:hypothetical protein [Streptomyces sp. NPDC051677]|uniref:hypothetical protein n=1 Tax=Streptomyces sp. NPDC051677 TaxID=3365669 RepID=UPI0037D21BA2
MALRRPPHPEPPPAGGRPERVQRYREVGAEFRVVDLPPIETAYWLIKPRTLVRGTWDEPMEAERDVGRLAGLVESAAERLAWGGDVSLGFYLEHPSYLSLAVVTCSPERAACPLR